jgi:hypothetical protein
MGVIEVLKDFLILEVGEKCQRKNCGSPEKSRMSIVAACGSSERWAFLSAAYETL